MEKKVKKEKQIFFDSGKKCLCVCVSIICGRRLWGRPGVMGISVRAKRSRTVQVPFPFVPAFRGVKLKRFCFSFLLGRKSCLLHQTLQNIASRCSARFFAFSPVAGHPSTREKSWGPEGIVAVGHRRVGALWLCDRHTGESVKAEEECRREGKRKRKRNEQRRVKEGKENNVEGRDDRGKKRAAGEYRWKDESSGDVSFPHSRRVAICLRRISALISFEWKMHSLRQPRVTREETWRWIFAFSLLYGGRKEETCLRSSESFCLRSGIADFFYFFENGFMTS